MQQRRWAWLIGKTDASDKELRAWAESFSAPPTVSVEGARLDAPAYVQERRAMRLVARSPSIEINLKPRTHTLNPVFEISGAAAHLTRLTLDGKELAESAYSWDGATLWVNADIDSSGATIGLRVHWAAALF